MLRRSCANWWINFFRDIVERGIYDLTDIVHINCIKFCFGDLLKIDLKEMQETWNNHRIRRGINTDEHFRPNGLPNILYSTHSILNGDIKDYKYAVNAQDINIVEEICCTEKKESFLCSQDFYILANILMSENNLNMPSNCDEALNLFNTLIRLINQI